MKQQSLAQQYLELSATIIESIDAPSVVGLHLPEPVEEAQKPDEFGFVFLDDGSVGPFYASLDDTLAQLWRRYPRPAALRCRLNQLLDGFQSDSQVLRALALGAFNALSHSVMRRADYSPRINTSDKLSPRPGDLVAFVGYIRPMIEGLLADGYRVLVLEKNPARVEPAAGLELSTDPGDLLRSDFIFCTASTLINDSLGDILGHRLPSVVLSLVGPSGSGLPDVLFRHGVSEVGGILVHDSAGLRAALDQQQVWGQCGNKYQLTPADYPGIDALLSSIRAREC